MWQSPVIVEPPAEQLVTLAEAKDACRLGAGATSFDAHLAILLAAAIDEVEGMTGQRISAQTVSIACSDFADLAHLPIGPVAAVSSLSYLDPLGDPQLIAAESYSLIGGELDWAIRPAPDYSWPSPLGVADAVRLQLIVGYEAIDDLPPSLRAAVLLHAQAAFNGRSFDIAAMLVNQRVYG